MIIGHISSNPRKSLVLISTLLELIGINVKQNKSAITLKIGDNKIVFLDCHHSDRMRGYNFDAVMFMEPIDPKLLGETLNPALMCSSLLELIK